MAGNDEALAEAQRWLREHLADEEQRRREPLGWLQTARMIEVEINLLKQEMAQAEGA